MLDASNARREDGILARSRVVRPLPTTVKNTASARMGNEQVAELSLPQSVSIEYTGTLGLHLHSTGGLLVSLSLLKPIPEGLYCKTIIHSASYSLLCERFMVRETRSRLQHEQDLSFGYFGGTVTLECTKSGTTSDTYAMMHLIVLY